MYMKKLLAVMLSVLLLVCSVGMTVSAGFVPGFNDDELDWGEYKGLVSIGDVSANPGKEFEVPVIIENNPGIVSFKWAVAYDTEVLELVSYKAGDYGVESESDENAGSLSFGDIEKSPFIINWMDYITTENNTTNGVAAYLTFKVKEGAAAGTTEISVSYDAEDVLDVDLNSMEFDVKAGTVTITTYKPGDINDDGAVNMRDLTTMQRYLAKWSGITYNEAALDCNGDGSVNMRDVTHLQRYLAKWEGIELH